VIARKLPAEYVGRTFLSAAFDPDFAVDLGHKSHTRKKATLITERGLLVTHSTADPSPYAATTFSSTATV